MSPTIPVLLITGPRSSGKTQLINLLMRVPQATKTLVIENERGHTTLNHALQLFSPEQWHQNFSSCSCCTPPTDLNKSLREATWRFSRQGQRQFDHAIIETAGHSNPAAILLALQNHPHFYAAHIACVISAHTTLSALEQPSLQQQIIMANSIIIFQHEDSISTQHTLLTQILATLNPFATIISITSTANSQSMHNLWQQLIQPMFHETTINAPRLSLVSQLSAANRQPLWQTYIKMPHQWHQGYIELSPLHTIENILKFFQVHCLKQAQYMLVARLILNTPNRQHLLYWQHFHAYQSIQQKNINHLQTMIDKPAYLSWQIYHCKIKGFIQKTGDTSKRI